MKTLIIYFSTIYTVVKTVSSSFFCKKKYREQGFFHSKFYSQSFDFKQDKFHFPSFHFEKLLELTNFIPKTKHFSILILIILQTFVFGQIENHQYKREIRGISEQWHKIELPDEIYKKLSADYSDLRIVGIAENKDTIEVPYLFKVADNKLISKVIDFKIMNQSYNEKGSYFTFEVPTKEDLNSINLSFQEDNFDWNVRLDGSQNQQEWFTILDDYRIVSLKNESVDFKHSELNFPTSKYRYYRLFIPTKNKPKLINATLNKQVKTVGNSKSYSVKKFEIKEEKSKTEIDFELETAVPISSLQIEIENYFDYYRQLSSKKHIKCLLFVFEPSGV